LELWKSCLVLFQAALEKQRSVSLFPSLRQLQQRFPLPITHYKAGIPKRLRKERFTGPIDRKALLLC